MKNYAVLSIETHLFFARIMREHALFLEAGFPGVNKDWIEQADWFRAQFEALLLDAVKLGNGRIGVPILRSGELVTEFTLPAENKTEFLSGISIDSSITRLEQNLRPGSRNCQINSELMGLIRQLNERALCLLDGLIAFKEELLKQIGRCSIFNANYPLLIQHILREAKLYRAAVRKLQENPQTSYSDLLGTEEFWNRIMMEHALFIRGLLDPSEEALIDAAEGFAADYKKLLEMAKQQDAKATEALTQKTLTETRKYSQFKAAGADGILNCRISSIILPLLADHVLREANHYIRLLESGRMK